MTALYELKYENFEIDSAVVFAPPKVVEATWIEEAGKWDHLSDLELSMCIGDEKKRVEGLTRKADVYVLSNAVVPWFVTWMLKEKRTFDVLVIDELSAFKSTQAIRFRALKRVRGKFSRYIGLTGTPTPNGLIDLWPQIFLLDGGISLGKTVSSFREHYFYPKKKNGHIVYEWGLKEGSEDKIYDRLRDTCISMKNTEYLKMPDRIDNFVRVNMSRKERKVYDELKKEYCLDIGSSEITAANAAVLSGKLLQMDSGALYDDEGVVVTIHDRKLDALEELIKEANGKPMIVVYNYKHSLSRIIDRFSDVCRLRVYNNPEDKKDWNNGKIDVLMIHPKSCKYGLNLQRGGSTMIWFDLTWSLDDYLQTNARVWRQGQENTVVIHHLVCEGTIDDKVIKALEGKENTQKALLNAIKAEIRTVERR